MLKLLLLAVHLRLPVSRFDSGDRLCSLLINESLGLLSLLAYHNLLVRFLPLRGLDLRRLVGLNGARRVPCEFGRMTFDLLMFLLRCIP